jgi:leucyl-tRNA synthetase
MEYLNTLESHQEVTYAELSTLLVLLAPFAPHIAEELWERIGHNFSVHTAPWPTYDPSALHAEVMTLIIQVNGRVRDRITVSYDSTEEAIRQETLASEKVQRFVGEKSIQRVVYVPGRLVNVVTTG